MTKLKTLLPLSEQLPWYPCNAAKELNEMDGYSAEQIAAYYLLNLRCWTEGSLPDDMDKLVRWCKGTVSAGAIQFILDEHFEQVEDGFWVSPKLDQMREGAMVQAARKSALGSKAVNARWDRDKQGKREPDTDVYARTTDVYGTIPIEKSRKQESKQNESTPEKSTQQETIRALPPINPSGSPAAQAEQLAKAANSTVKHLLESRQEDLTGAQKTAKLKIIQLNSEARAA